MREHSTVIVFLGPPGSGKGTQAARLSETLGIPAISTGEMLRQAAKSRSELGKIVESVMARGQLVSDDLINQVVADRLRRADCGSGCILDGYPRTQSQAHYLKALLNRLHLPEPVIVNFEISVEEVISRLSGRRQCPQCGGIFTVRPDVEPTRCNRDGTLLIQRADDNPAAIRKRLELYHATSADVINFYRTENYHEISASQPPKQISDELLRLLGRHTRTPRAPAVRHPMHLPATA